MISSVTNPHLVSIHGGHSGEFCCHANDTLDEIIKAYIQKGFSWVGITEHMPFSSDEFLYPEEKEAGLDVKGTYRRFADYIFKCRKLQKKYSSSIKIYVGFETELFSGFEPFIKKLIQNFQPDYIVGSLHHVNNMGFDYSKQQYDETARTIGGIEALYCEYFDQQYELIKALKPEVVGHFDLIRIFDPNYHIQLKKPDVQKRIERNLKLIKQFNLIIDYNLRSLYTGASEPYPSKPILLQALDLGIPVVPGDDSHSVGTVGRCVDEEIKILQKLGFDTRWKKPC
ncbi:MAG: histidinol-phosphatase HisJ [Deltaproteobacteria bacterium]|nr:histidinol-phosphatase HisJ [Deltaproteobacteria bacterium]